MRLSAINFTSPAFSSPAAQTTAVAPAFGRKESFFKETWPTRIRDSFRDPVVGPLRQHRWESLVGKWSRNADPTWGDMARASIANVIRAKDIGYEKQHLWTPERVEELLRPLLSHDDLSVRLKAADTAANYVEAGFSSAATSRAVAERSVANKRGSVLSLSA